MVVLPWRVRFPQKNLQGLYSGETIDRIAKIRELQTNADIFYHHGDYGEGTAHASRKLKSSTFLCLFVCVSVTLLTEQQSCCNSTAIKPTT